MPGMLHGCRQACLLLILALLPLSCSARLRQYKVRVIKEYPHAETSYTQGLFFHEGVLYESTGMHGESAFMSVDMATGKSLRRLDFARKYFVEGSVILDGKLYVLTWENKAAFVYDAQTLKYLSTYSYPREGWGLTTDGKQLIASDGSARLFFMDKAFNVQKTVTVRLDGRPVNFLNELEYIGGKIWANVYTTDLIVIADPDTGNVEATVDCSGLLPAALRTSRTDVLNGIAHDVSSGKTYLTGKYWPRLYEIELKER